MRSLMSVPSPVSHLRRLCVAVGTGLLLACGASNTGDADPPDGGDGGLVGCQPYTGLEAFAPNLVQQGQAKNFTFVLVSSTPTPPAVEQNTWVLQVLDASNNPVSGASITFCRPLHADDGPRHIDPTVDAQF